MRLAPEHHHDDAHEWAEQERQERENRIGIDRARSDKDYEQTADAEENEYCFP